MKNAARRFSLLPHPKEGPAMPQLKDCTLTLEDRVAVLTFQRDDVRNALTGTALAEDIITTINWVNAEDCVSVLVMTGAGSAFSSGGNVKEMQAQSGIFGGSPVQVQDKYRRGIQQIPLLLHKAEIPVIAAINGPAIGAGFDLANMCDIRIASTRAKVGETFINLGITPGDGGAWFMQRLLGYQRAAELIFTGRVIDAAEALKLGIFLEVVDPEELLPRTMELAREIASKPPVTLRLTKRMMKLAQRSDLPDFLDLCACFQSFAHHTEDHLEAVDAFLEKRKPTYKGR
ncbi:enoyl-CoA hydratase/isomerase family protein [Geomonas subterranea]|uniref:Enoyl-CoA hydratase/isomerase family protein n=1 Tax=Geomonas subterranea TaxID=2847989 RepID=A0ABX8LIP4_9BACT|nr:enoyl-CoA hydratase-related protein [Geomonas subterranea]QXE91339.1 enoyl-CoA hydratase/isomerase family protein [Geomonas subterranea]QXM10574.1 enoyl-CoA hydratase/isomerase family protein [Geomonas subterranea]